MKKKIFKNVSLFIVAFVLGFFVNEYRHIVIEFNKGMSAVGESMSVISEVFSDFSVVKSDTIQEVEIDTLITPSN